MANVPFQKPNSKDQRGRSNILLHIYLTVAQLFNKT